MRKSPVRLTVVEIEFIRANYPRLNSYEIANSLSRSQGVIYGCIKRLGLVAQQSQQGLAKQNLRRCWQCKTVSSIDTFGNVLVSGKFKRKQSRCNKCSSLASTKTQNKKYDSLEEYSRRCLLTSTRLRYDCTLTSQDIIDLYQKQRGLCFYSGQKMLLTPKMPQTISIDRLDSARGYHKDNSVLCCKAANLMKQSMDCREFFDWCNAIAKHFVLNT